MSAVLRVRSAVLGVAVLVLAACGAGGPLGGGGGGDPITIAVQPTQTAAELTTSANEIADFLTQRVGRKVELVFPTTYAGVVEALRFGSADAAFLSAWPARLAAKYAGAEIGLAEVREVVIGQEKKNETFYYSYWVVLPNSTVAKLEDLRGKKVAFASPLSTSGYVAPLARLVELGLVAKPAAGKEADPKTFFGEVAFAGGYAQGWAALKAGQVDATIIAGDVAESLYREVLAGSKVVDQQGPVPSHAVAFSKDLDKSTKQALKDALIALGDEQHRPLMRKFISGIFVGFRETSAEEHLGSLATFLDATGLAFTESIR